MAVLTAADYGTIRRDIYRKGNAKAYLKALPSLPNEAQILAAFQAMENRFQNARSNYKTDIETAFGVTVTGALARKLTIAYLRWKLAKMEGE